MDLHFLERTGARRSSSTFYDYRTNVALYPQWQAFLQERRPKTLILWGENDIFTPEGGRTCAICPRPSCTCSTAATSRSRTRSRRSSRALSASTRRGRRPRGRPAAEPVGSALVVLSVNVGLPREVIWRGKPVATGIYKQPVAGRVVIRALNLDGDRQADLRVHGGPDKAVYAYPSEFYELWSRERPELEFGRRVRRQPHDRGSSTATSRRRSLPRGNCRAGRDPAAASCFKLGIKMGRDGS